MSPQLEIGDFISTASPGFRVVHPTKPGPIVLGASISGTGFPLRVIRIEN
jgi:hypothetical protein